MTTTKTKTELRLRKLPLFAHCGYAPHEAQMLVHKSRAPRRVVASGVRVGKSTIGVYEAVAALLEPRDQSLGWLVSGTYDLTSRIFRRAVEVLHTRFAHRVLKFDAREHTIQIANLGGGVSVLRAKSTDRPVSLLGEALDFLIVDECAKLRNDIWSEHLAPRLLDRNGWALLLSTPNGPGWFHDEFVRGTRKVPDPSYACWSFPTSANPFIDAALIEAERERLPPDVFAAQYEARFIGVPVERCPKCLGPAPISAPMAIVHFGEEVPKCSECGRSVCKEGMTCVWLRDGVEQEGVIVLDRRESHLPEEERHRRALAALPP